MSLDNALAIFNHSLVSRIITSKHAAQRMVRARTGLIVQITENDLLGSSGNVVTQCVRLSHKWLALATATELEEHGVAVLALTPGFLRSEPVLEFFGVTERNWRDAGQKDANFLESESPLFVGRAVAALAADPKILERTGQLLSSWQLARDYGFTDYDGRRPDWGKLAIDFSTMPPALTASIRRGTELQLRWLETLVPRTREFLAKFPPGPPAESD
jgi:NAD(P)-dependent dehydrogenase (short-subunit alcohol dehydrogenase family)